LIQIHRVIKDPERKLRPGIAGLLAMTAAD
jgi:hypothetical protein